MNIYNSTVCAIGKVQISRVFRINSPKIANK